MILLRFDRQHIRLFRSNSGDITPSGFADDLLPFSENLFTTTSSLTVSESQFNQLKSLAKVLSKPFNLLKIVNVFPFECEYQGTKFCLSKEKTLFWQDCFEKNRLIHTATVRFSTNHAIQPLWDQFCADLGLHLEDRVLAISGLDFFLPIEWAKYPCFFIEEPQKSLVSRTFRSLTMFFDKNLPFAQQEAQQIVALSVKRRWSIESPKPDILFISGHGEDGHLENEVLTEKFNLFQPLLTVINACSLQALSLPQGPVIYSPYDTEADRSVFTPLMRFLYSSAPQSLLQAFFIASIFYPNIAYFYRLKISIPESVLSH